MMVIDMKVNLKMINLKEKVYIILMMEKYKKKNGTMIKKKKKKKLLTKRLGKVIYMKAN